jgi:quercetin dioxygenase-like cupin family protein
MDDTVLHEFKGGKGDVLNKMYTDDLSKIMIGRLAPGCSIGFHQHEASCEMIYILEGKADFLYDEGIETALPGECHYCPKGHWHSMLNNGEEDLVYFAIVPVQ